MDERKAEKRRPRHSDQQASSENSSPDTILSQPQHPGPEEMKRMAFAFETLAEDAVPAQGDTYVIADINEVISSESQDQAPSEEPAPTTTPPGHYGSHRKELALRNPSGGVVHHPISERRVAFSPPAAIGSGLPDQTWEGWKKASVARFFFRPWRKLDLEQLIDLGLTQAEAHVVYGLFRGQDIEEVASRSGLDIIAVLSTRTRLMDRFGVTSPDRLLDIIWTLHRERESSATSEKQARESTNLTKLREQSFHPIPSWVHNIATVSGPGKRNKWNIPVTREEVQHIGLGPEFTVVAFSILNGNLKREEVVKDTGLPADRLVEVERTFEGVFDTKDYQKVASYLLVSLGRKPNLKTKTTVQQKPEFYFNADMSDSTTHTARKKKEE
ncbi:helix-turn-helix transcriptional regulator [Arthrobacter sp. SLBN-122]|uniref:helix-turn-helix transcriptional regulator n=1 Tax=Arthrobacter sp. SLBN-122 TaxID=2768455 RepID=UPI001152A8F3|nr:hypothetical protein [Arthrobacter sp. SLBN-122]